jgi:ferrochelatase
MTTGVLLMAYGSPRSLDEVEPYLTDIRGGRPSSPEAIASLRSRYERIGGGSPLLEITTRQAEGVQRALGDGFRVAIGMKHWHPYVAQGVQELIAGGADRIIGLALAPHYSGISIGGYASRATDAIAGRVPFEMVPHWYDELSFVELLGSRLRAALGDWGGSGGRQRPKGAAAPRGDQERNGFSGARVFFTAHSLPARIIDEGDPYLDQLQHSAKLVAERAGASDFEFCFQSASATGEPWLGPDVLERLESFAAEGGARAVVAPIGFVSDHLEILFDVDVECVETAARLGLELRRTPSLNDAPEFCEVLARVAQGAWGTSTAARVAGPRGAIPHPDKGRTT